MFNFGNFLLRTQNYEPPATSYHLFPPQSAAVFGGIEQ